MFELLLILASASGVLLLATATGIALQLRAGDGAQSVAVANLNQRIKAWWAIVFVFSGALLAGRAGVTGVFAIVSFLALREFLTVSRAGSADRHALLASCLIVLPVQYALIGLGWREAFVTFVPLAAILAIPPLSLIGGDTKNLLARISEHVLGLMLCVYCLSHVPALLMLDIGGGRDRQILLVVFLVLVAQASDVLQYVWGKLVGRHRIAPLLSPHKTVEGLTGGLACATALGAGLWWITPFTRLEAAATALLIALAGFLGGLVLSAVKRDRGVKDWSHFISGHGGVLDRADSLWFSAPVFFYLTKYLTS